MQISRITVELLQIVLCVVLLLSKCGLKANAVFGGVVGKTKFRGQNIRHLKHLVFYGSTKMVYCMPVNNFLLDATFVLVYN